MHFTCFHIISLYIHFNCFTRKSSFHHFHERTIVPKKMGAFRLRFSPAHRPGFPRPSGPLDRHSAVVRAPGRRTTLGAAGMKRETSEGSPNLQKQNQQKKVTIHSTHFFFWGGGFCCVMLLFTILRLKMGWDGFSSGVSFFQLCFQKQGRPFEGKANKNDN